MILQRLRYFVAVARQGGVGRAAAALRVAQPALSRQIQAFERQVGAPLFERLHHGVRLTPAGTALQAHAEALLARLDRAARKARLAHDGRLGTVRLGLGRVAVSQAVIGKGIATIRCSFPDVALVIEEVASFSQPAALRAGALDLAIGVEGTSVDTTLRREEIFPDAVDRALLHADHPLANSRRIKPTQLRGERLMMLPAASVPLPDVFDTLRRLGFSEWEEYASMDTVYGLTAAGYGWTTHLRSMPTPAGTVAVPLAGLDVPMSLVIRWKAASESPLIRNVVDAFLGETGNQPGCAPRRAPHPPAPPSTTMDESPGPANVNLRHLRALIAVVEAGSLIDAARRLGITQSGLSRQIRALEREVRVPLLLRRPARALLTPAGAAFHGEAALALELVDDAVAHARRACRTGAGRGMAGTCNVGAIPSELAGDLVTRVLDDVSRRFPGVAVEVREVLTPRQLDALRAREIDVGIASGIPGLVDDPAIESVRLKEDVVDCALVAASHPLAAKPVLAPKDLAGEPFIFIDRATFPRLYDLVLQRFEELGLTPRIDAAINGPRASWRLAADGLGWTIGTCAFRAHPLPGVVCIPIEGFSIATGVELLWRRDENNAIVRAVIDAFTRAAASPLRG